MALAACVAWGVPVLLADEVTADTGELRVVGRLESGMPDSAKPLPPGLLVDGTLHRGFVLNDSLPPTLYVYDLVALAIVAKVPAPSDFRNVQRPVAAVDEVHHRVFFVDDPPGAPGCGANFLFVFDSRALTWSKKQIPCVNGDSYAISGISYHAPSNKIHAVGYHGSLAVPVNIGNLPAIHVPAIYRQLDPDSLQADWTVDASMSCDWHQLNVAPVVLRVKDALLGYCLQGGLNQNAGGGRGVVIRVPLTPDGRLQGGSDTIKAAPTYQDAGVVVVPDRETGRLLLLSRNAPFGPAAWVYDGLSSLFVGVVPTGVPVDKSREIGVGFDQVGGRLYVRTVRGIVVLDARHSPLPGGVSHDTLAGPIIPQTAPDLLAVDHGLRRVFVPDAATRSWVVVEDRVPVAPPQPTPDPDEGTADIPEQSGATDRVLAGGSTAFGVHLLNVGGVPTALQVATHRLDCVGRRVDPSSACATEAVVSPGQREAFMAASDGRVGSRSGASASATSAGNSPRDFATDADIRAVGSCGADRAGLLSQAVRAGVAAVCPPSTPPPPAESFEGLTLQQIRGGSQGADGNGFPVRSSRCLDLGDGLGARRSDSQSSAVGSSSVRCEAQYSAVSAASSARAMTLGSPDGPPVLDIARTASSVRSELTPEGIVTRAHSVVEGVVLFGTLSIDRIETDAVTRARGRSGTANASFRRTFTGVRTPGFQCDSHCPPREVEAALQRALADQEMQCAEVDGGVRCAPAELAAQSNRHFGTNVLVRVPNVRTMATPRGYTGLVAKDAALAVSDRAINGDETVQAVGLSIVLINDYSRGSSLGDGQQVAGRSRLVIGLAGVQAESHYGVFRLPADVAVTADDGLPTAMGLLSSVSEGASGPSAFGSDFAPVLSAQAATTTGATGAANAAARLPSITGLLEAAIRLFVNSPGQAALLALLIGLLGLPFYLTARRRAWIDAVTAPP